MRSSNFCFQPIWNTLLYSNWIICTITLSKNDYTFTPWETTNALLGTNNQHFLKMIFLFPRWEILVPWRVYNGPTLYLSTFLRAPPTASTVGSAKSSYVGEAWSIPDILPIPSLPVPYIFTVDPGSLPDIFRLAWEQHFPKRTGRSGNVSRTQ